MQFDYWQDPNRIFFQAAVLTFSVLSGVACVPVIPLAFELIAEATYPVHQAISSSIVYLWSGIIGSLMIGAELGLDSGISGLATIGTSKTSAFSTNAQ